MIRRVFFYLTVAAWLTVAIPAAAYLAVLLESEMPRWAKRQQSPKQAARTLQEVPTNRGHLRPPARLFSWSVFPWTQTNS